MIIIHAYTITIVHAYISTTLIVQACTMLLVHVWCHIWLMFGAIQVGGSGGGQLLCISWTWFNFVGLNILLHWLHKGFLWFITYPRRCTSTFSSVPKLLVRTWVKILAIFHSCPLELSSRQVEVTHPTTARVAGLLRKVCSYIPVAIYNPQRNWLDSLNLKVCLYFSFRCAGFSGSSEGAIGLVRCFMSIGVEIVSKYSLGIDLWILDVSNIVCL